MNNIGINLDGLNELSNEINKSSSRGKYNVRARLPKSTISFLVNHEVFKSFDQIGFSFFKSNQAKAQFSGANFWRTILINMHTYLEAKYGKIDVTEDEIEFLKSTGKKRFDIIDFGYPHFKDELKTYTFTLEKKFIELTYIIASSYYKLEREEQVDIYTINMFFYDVMDLIEKDILKLKFYNKVDITEFIEEY